MQWRFDSKYWWNGRMKKKSTKLSRTDISFSLIWTDRTWCLTVVFVYKIHIYISGHLLKFSWGTRWEIHCQNDKSIFNHSPRIGKQQSANCAIAYIEQQNNKIICWQFKIRKQHQAYERRFWMKKKLIK